jgi:hypothetical protein
MMPIKHIIWNLECKHFVITSELESKWSRNIFY